MCEAETCKELMNMRGGLYINLLFIPECKELLEATCILYKKYFLLSCF